MLCKSAVDPSLLHVCNWGRHLRLQAFLRLLFPHLPHFAISALPSAYLCRDLSSGLCPPAAPGSSPARRALTTRLWACAASDPCGCRPPLHLSPPCPHLTLSYQETAWSEHHLSLQD